MIALAPEMESSNDARLADLERQICELAADLAAATYRWLLLIAEFDAAGGWAQVGTVSCAHWLSWRLGIGLRAAQEHVRVARCLGALPLLSERFAAGELTYSKVRAITRVAQPETEADLVEISRHATGAQLERLVRGYAGVIRATREKAQLDEEKQYLRCEWTEDGMLRVDGKLTAEIGARLLAALEAAETPDTSLRPGARRAQALAVLAAGGKPGGAEVIVHLDADTLGADSVKEHCEVQDGPAVAPETARRLGCDAAVVSIVERDGQPLSVGRRTRTINPALRRALKSRDKGCRFPSCTHTRYLQAHHIEHWARGGRTDIDNLIQLCPQHHKLVHEGGYKIDLDRAGLPRFRNPGGWVIPPVGEPPASAGPPLRWQNAASGVAVNADTVRPLSAGDRLDYEMAVEGLARKWLPPPR